MKLIFGILRDYDIAVDLAAELLGKVCLGNDFLFLTESDSFQVDARHQQVSLYPVMRTQDVYVWAIAEARHYAGGLRDNRNVRCVSEKSIKILYEHGDFAACIAENQYLRGQMPLILIRLDGDPNHGILAVKTVLNHTQYPVRVLHTYEHV